MKILAALGDKRYAYMVSCARAEGIDAWTYKIDTAGVSGTPELDAFELASVDCVVLPPLFVKPLSPEAEALLTQLSPGTTLALFSAGGVPEDIRRRFRVIDLSRDEQFVRENAVLTAEGALSAAMIRAEFALRQSRCLVIGYGRIGYALTEMLVALEARVIVAARKDAARKQAIQRGAEVADMDEMARILRDQQIVFCTPPERVLGEGQLLRMNPSALLIDLSSPPYGVDLPAAVLLGIDAWREPALPGRYCPQSAGEALFRALQIALK